MHPRPHAIDMCAQKVKEYLGLVAHPNLVNAVGLLLVRARVVIINAGFGLGLMLYVRMRVIVQNTG